MPRSLSNPLLDSGFPSLKRRIIERTGHFYYQDKDDLLWERVRKRLRATGTRDSAGYLEFLDDAVSGPPEWSRLEAEITIGETFFFRYAEQFAALRETILPDLIERKRSLRRLRVWSAGCATGAEAYSLSILINELLGQEREAWRVSIVGTDINDGFLELARQARFGKWALRTLPAEERDRYFVPAGREQWQLRPEYRSAVRFERHNLMSLLDGTSPLEFTEFDLILCRNVLIYFHPDAVLGIVAALRDCLIDDGWMLLGHAEPNPAFSDLMQAMSLPGTVAYRRPAHPLPADPAIGPGRVQPSASWQPLLPPARPQRPEPTRGAPTPRSPRPLRPQARPAPPPVEPPDALLDAVRARADAGDFPAAEALCRKALAADPLHPALHFYQGLIALGMRRPAEAETAFRKSLYLDKSFAMAHYHLGLLLLASGQAGPGRRSLSSAARIAAALPAERALPEADGLTAGELQGLVRAHLEPAREARNRR